MPRFKLVTSAERAAEKLRIEDVKTEKEKLHLSRTLVSGFTLCRTLIKFATWNVLSGDCVERIEEMLRGKFVCPKPMCDLILDQQDFQGRGGESVGHVSGSSSCVASASSRERSVDIQEPRPASRQGMDPVRFFVMPRCVQ